MTADGGDVGTWQWTLAVAGLEPGERDSDEDDGHGRSKMVISCICVK